MASSGDLGATDPGRGREQADIGVGDGGDLGVAVDHALLGGEGLEGDLVVAAQPARVPAAVLALVVLVGHVGGGDAQAVVLAQDGVAEGGMLPQQQALLLGVGPGLVHQVVREHHLPEIHQQAAQGQLLDLAVGVLQLVGQDDGGHRHVQGVLEQVAALGADGGQVDRHRLLGDQIVQDLLDDLLDLLHRDDVLEAGGVGEHPGDAVMGQGLDLADLAEDVGVLACTTNWDWRASCSLTVSSGMMHSVPSSAIQQAVSSISRILARMRSLIT